MPEELNGTSEISARLRSIYKQETTEESIEDPGDTLETKQ